MWEKYPTVAICRGIIIARDFNIDTSLLLNLTATLETVICAPDQFNCTNTALTLFILARERFSPPYKTVFSK